MPVPSDADSPSFKTVIGKVEYQPDKDSVVWRISKFTGQKEYSHESVVRPALCARGGGAQPRRRGWG